LTHKWGKALARHGNIFLLDTEACCLILIVPGMRISFVQ
jgi:hypothetical protein